ncbi:hypothetical protein JMJ35_004493 [Cladonia borealis]|uniref:Nuclear transport factor 2 n=1 Tax=Cladonia borealis TaxID=184061 RepID=A0AA39V2N0_9LECA|nr:hypothetical protein JMJ35_004493 [Cladonia borealis]
MDDFNTIAQQFVQFYYNTFDSDRGLLAALYREHSMLTFESTASKGVNDIIEKLQSLPFGKIIHQVATVDAQPSNESGGIIVMVTGALLVEGEEKPMSYSQVFQLLPEAGTYYAFNDVFKLVYPA